jgi:hypothetical protein
VVDASDDAGGERLGDLRVGELLRAGERAPRAAGMSAGDDRDVFEQDAAAGEPLVEPPVMRPPRGRPGGSPPRRGGSICTGWSPP